VGLDGNVLHVYAAVGTDVAISPKIDNLALSELIICSPDLFKINSQGVSVLIIPVNGDNCEKASIVNLRSTKYFYGL
jgi:hypothetical protein